MTPSLILHGGAGSPAPDLHQAREHGLRQAFMAAWSILTQGGAALDAVVRAVVELENDPAFNAGVGSCLNQDGAVEMDASLMEGSTFRCGAVGAVRTVQNPILLAQAVMEEGRHVFLVGEGAERFAREKGFAEVTQDRLITELQRQRWRDAQTSGEPGTVGAVAFDKEGRLAAATSTGGIFNKYPGRVGDSAVIGAGTYADDSLGAASATGAGEAIIRTTLARTAVEFLRGGIEPTQAARRAIHLFQKRTNSEAGIILIDALGRVGYVHNAPAMSVAFLSVDTVVMID
ncbi:MAG TPA: isoaspartyl peptidase/L-asparaginase family protein [Methylomirabilota bacterium]|nr:isoaspartyl peptidase/L-asparaginase family protein [Methylomirabilota bacterium]